MNNIESELLRAEYKGYESLLYKERRGSKNYVRSYFKDVALEIGVCRIHYHVSVAPSTLLKVTYYEVCLVFDVQNIKAEMYLKDDLESPKTIEEIEKIAAGIVGKIRGI